MLFSVNYFHNQWKKEWLNCQTKVDEINLLVFPKNTPKKQETAINCLRISHTYLTYQNLIKKISFNVPAMTSP